MRMSEGYSLMQENYQKDVCLFHTKTKTSINNSLFVTLCSIQKQHYPPKLDFAGHTIHRKTCGKGNMPLNFNLCITSSAVAAM